MVNDGVDIGCGLSGFCLACVFDSKTMANNLVWMQFENYGFLNLYKNCM